MEGNILKQAKNDIYSALEKIIDSDMKNSIKPESIKKYYKKDSHFPDILKRIKNKGINLFDDEKHYKEVVKEILNDILQDHIYAEKDKKSTKHIKEYLTYINEKHT